MSSQFFTRVNQSVGANAVSRPRTSDLCRTTPATTIVDSYLLGGGRGRAAAAGGQADVGLVSIIDTPLETGQCSNHDNTEGQTAGEQGDPSHLLDDLSGGDTLAGVKLRDEQVSRVGHRSAEHASNVPGSETDTELLGLVALLLRLRDNVLVQGLDGVLEGSEFHHCVRNLSRPEWRQSLEQASDSFLGDELRETAIANVWVVD